MTTPDIREAFRIGSEAMGNDPLRIFQFYDKYSRWNGERRETWPECVQRSITFLKGLVKACNTELPLETWDFLTSQITKMDALPSMRLLAMAGPAAERDHVSIYNCSYQPIDSLESIKESLLISMAGCGDGYSVEHQFTDLLPHVKQQRNVSPTIFTVPDDSQGWATALYTGLQHWFDGYDIHYDYSQVRSAGALLKTKGGRASGPKPLRDLLRFTRDLILSKQGKRLQPIDVNDIMTMTGTAGNSGGVRRAAKISISDWQDTHMASAKDGEFWRENPWRSYANNSAAWPMGGPDYNEFIAQMDQMFAGRSGERGIFSRENALTTMPKARADFLRAKGVARKIGLNPCGEIVLQPRQFCNLTIGVCRANDTAADLLRKIRAATLLGTIQATATNFPYLGPEWKQTCEEERLLGVDMTGQMDCATVRDPLVMSMLRAEARKVNKEYAALLGIRESAAITCCKPNGNSSVFVGCAPGLARRKFTYGIRNVRVNTTSPVFRVLRHAGVPLDPENGQVAETADTWVAHFPMAAPEGALVTRDQTAIAQLEHWKLNKVHYTEHNPSCTIEYGPDEMSDVVSWVWANRSIIGGLSFLPRHDSVYQQMPYVETSKEDYDRAVAAFPAIDWSMIATFETLDQTTQAQEFACLSGACEM